MQYPSICQILNYFYLYSILYLLIIVLYIEKMITNNINKLAEELEKQELEVRNTFVYYVRLL